MNIILHVEYDTILCYADPKNSHKNEQKEEQYFL